MFCPECGKKNKIGSNFCEDCGTKLSFINNKKNITNVINEKNRKFIIILSLMSLIIIFGFIFLSNQCKPSYVASDYFLAYINGDSNKIYKYLNVDNSGLTSKKIFNKVSDLEKKDLLNYSIISEEKSDDGLTNTVKINYTLRGNISSSVMTINLVKDKKNKFLFFDNWKVNNELSSLMKDYRIIVPKSSALKIEGINIDKNYLGSYYDLNYDSYIIPQIFLGKYNVSVTLNNGLNLNGDMSVRKYGRSNLTNLSISDSEKNKIEKDLPSIISFLYQSALLKKPFSDIKEKFTYDNANLSDLESAYNSFMDSVSSSGLTKFDVKNVSISNTKISGSYVTVSAKVNYEYTVIKSLFGEEKKNTKEDSSTMYFDFDYVNGNYKLVRISSMVKYFRVI